MSSDYHHFETQRLILKPTDQDDAYFVLAIMNSPKWLQNIGDRNVYSIDDAKQYINEKMRPQLERLGYSNYTMITKEANEKIGSCGLYNREELEGIDIGFALLPDFEKKGFGFEAALKIKEVAKKVFGLMELSAITTDENVASQKLLEKLGLTHEDNIAIKGEELRLYKMNL